MKVVSFFNNKGGVGKTTLTCNIAAHFAQSFDKRVLLIDCDPQCNATLLILGEERATPLYWPELAAKEEEKADTLLEAVKPLEEGDPAINTKVKPISGKKNRFGIDLLPGHPRLSIIEDRLSQAWRDTIGGDVGGLRKTNWCFTLMSTLHEKYDYVFLDLGPSLGAVNRTALLGSDFFVTPMGADIFSMIGIRNIADWLKEWLQFYSMGIASCKASTPAAFAKHDFCTNPPVAHGFAGYTIQSYIAKYSKGVRRPTKAYEQIISDFPSEIRKNLKPYYTQGLKTKTAKLGEVPNMYSLVPLAQSVSAPIMDLKAGDGLVGSHFQQAAKYAEILQSVSQALLENLTKD